MAKLMILVVCIIITSNFIQNKRSRNIEPRTRVGRTQLRQGIETDTNIQAVYIQNQNHKNVMQGAPQRIAAQQSTLAQIFKNVFGSSMTSKLKTDLILLLLSLVMSPLDPISTQIEFSLVANIL